MLDGGEEEDDEDVPRVTKAVPEPAPAPVPSAEYTPTEVVPAVSVPAEPAPAEAEPAMQQEAEPAPPRSPPGAEPAQPCRAAPPAGRQALPVPNYDQLSVASLRARLRVLDAGQVQALLDYENAHESRPAVITMFERRLTKLGEGN